MTVDGSGELVVLFYELFSQTEILGRMALDRMLAGLSTRGVLDVFDRPVIQRCQLHYADRRIMPRWSLDSLAMAVIGLQILYQNGRQPAAPWHVGGVVRRDLPRPQRLGVRVR